MDQTIADTLAPPWQPSCPRETLVPPKCPVSGHRPVACARRVQSQLAHPADDPGVQAPGVHSDHWLASNPQLGLTCRHLKPLQEKQRFTSKGLFSFMMWWLARASLWASALVATTKLVLARFLSKKRSASVLKRFAKLTDLTTSYFLLCTLREHGIDGVFEQQGARRRSTDFRRGRRLGARDHLIELPKPKIRPSWMSAQDYESAPERLTVRELSTGGKVLVTTLLCPQHTPKAELKALYRQRWHVELDLRNLKTILGIKRLSCATPAMAEKEIWIYLLAYNLIRVMIGTSGGTRRMFTAPAQLQAYRAVVDPLASLRTGL